MSLKILGFELYRSNYIELEVISSSKKRLLNFIRLWVIFKLFKYNKSNTLLNLVKPGKKFTGFLKI